MVQGERSDLGLKKKHERDADLAFWFHVPPEGKGKKGAITEGQRIGLLLNKRRVQAQQAIHLGLIDPVDYQGAYQTFYDAYGNEELAQKAKSAALKRYVDWKIANHEAKTK